MKLLISRFNLILFSFLFIFLSCQNEKTAPDPLIMDVELLRGELILCSGSEFGEVDFGLACDASVQETFNLAVALLHSFEYEEAEKAFVQVMDADPDCAMAYWGVAMSIYHSAWGEPPVKDLEKGTKILKIARTLPKPLRHKKYIDAISAFYDDWKKLDHNARELKYEKEMQKIHEEDKDDIEAAIFYSLALYSSADLNDKSYTKQRKAGKILEELVIDYPNHPGIAHYIIHNYDNPVLAHLALPTARRYADIAPASSHAQHMPSHIFTRLGLWEESIESNVNSAASAVCYAQETNMDGHWMNEIHAMDYLVYAYLQRGDNQNARIQYDQIRTMKQVNPHNIFAIAYPFAAIPARMALENKNWVEAAKIVLHDSEIQWEDFPWQKSIFHFARALGSSQTNDYASAEKEIDTLHSLRQKIMDSEYPQKAHQADQVLIQIKSAQAWLRFAKGDHKEALALMQEAANLEDKTEKHGVTPGEVLPASELLGDMLLALNNSEDALVAYEHNLEARPNRFNSVYGAAMASKNLGKSKEAAGYFESLLKLAEGVDSDRPELIQARDYVSNI